MAPDEWLTPADSSPASDAPSELLPAEQSEIVPSLVPAGRSGRFPGPMAVGLGLMVVVAGGAFLIGRGIRSAEQAIADAAPPEPTVITVPVEERQLVETVTFRADVDLEVLQPIVLSSAEEIPIVTEVLIEETNTVEEGMPLLSINGARVVALEGNLPLYRDLTPYVEGPDVAQLQAALVRLGYPVGAPGVFDTTTQQSMGELFRVAGMTLDLSGDPDLVRAVQDAELAVDLANDGSVAAREGLAAAQNEKAAGIDAADAALAEAQGQQRLIELEVTQSVGQAEDEVVIEQALVDELESENPVNQEALAAALAVLADAEDAFDLAVVEADIARQQAARAVADAGGSLDRARSLSVSAFRRAIAAADVEKGRAQGALDEARLVAGLVVRRDWLSFVPELPATVVRSDLALGMNLTNAAGPLLELSNGELVAVAQLEEVVATQLVPGMSVEVSDGAAFVEATVRLGQAEGSSPNTDGSSDTAVVLEFTTPPPSNWRGLNVKVTAGLSRTDRPVLAVPISAIYTGATGTRYVWRVGATGESVKVTVRTGIVASGYVEIEPIDGPLAIGHMVEVGTQP